MAMSSRRPATATLKPVAQELGTVLSGSRVAGFALRVLSRAAVTLMPWPKGIPIEGCRGFVDDLANHVQSDFVSITSPAQQNAST
jgi:hypothetical protein